MTKRGAIFLGIITILPIAFLLFFFFIPLLCYLSPSFCTYLHIKDLWNIVWGDLFMPIYMVGIITLLIFYILYLRKTDVVPKNKKALWTAVLFLGYLAAMPVFWYYYIWKKHSITSNSTDSINSN